MRKVCLAAAALMLSAVLAGCSFEGTASPGSEPGGETAKTTAAKAEVAGVGDTVSGDKWSISLQSAKLFDEIKENEFLTDKPEEGKQFLVLFFEVENLSAEDEYFNYLNFENYVDGYNQALKVLFTKPDGYSALTGRRRRREEAEGVPRLGGIQGLEGTRNLIQGRPVER